MCLSSEDVLLAPLPSPSSSPPRRPWPASLFLFYFYFVSHRAAVQGPRQRLDSLGTRGMTVPESLVGGGGGEWGA